MRFCSVSCTSCADGNATRLLLAEPAAAGAPTEPAAVSEKTLLNAGRLMLAAHVLHTDTRRALHEELSGLVSAGEVSLIGLLLEASSGEDGAGELGGELDMMEPKDYGRSEWPRMPCKWIPPHDGGANILRSFSRNPAAQHPHGATAPCARRMVRFP